MDDGGRRSCNGSRRDSTCGSFGAGGSVDPVSGTTLLHTAALEIRFGRDRLPIDRVCRCVPRIEPVRLDRASKRSAADEPSAGGTLPGHIDGRSASIRTDEATLLICSLRVGIVEASDAVDRARPTRGVDRFHPTIVDSTASVPCRSSEFTADRTVSTD